MKKILSILVLIFVEIIANAQSCPDKNHPHLIDLGLPSGTKWACCNVGANTPEDYGGYYAWGETEDKEVYDEVTYKYCRGVDEDGDGWYDFNYIFQNPGSNICGTEYDVAHVKWGGDWQMPSFDMLRELVNYCYFKWTTLNGIKGVLFTGSNGKNIFFPAAGFRMEADIKYKNEEGWYRSGIQNSETVYYSYGLGLVGGSYGYSSQFYYTDGFPVRPVVKEVLKELELSIKDSITLSVGGGELVFEIVSGNSDYLVESSNPEIATAEIIDGKKIKVIAFMAGKTSITVKDKISGQIVVVEVTVIANQIEVLCPDDHHPHMIDLGLSVKWACCNVGANEPLDFGSYYAWGEIEEKEVYNDLTYQYNSGIDEDTDGDGWFDHIISGRQYQYLDSNISGTQYDVAHMKWGGNWQMPSKFQLSELQRYCTNMWTSMNGINGLIITSKKNGKSIFVPSAGYRSGSDFNELYSYGSYWLGNHGSYGSPTMYTVFYITSSKWGLGEGSGLRNSEGLTVRPVWVDDALLKLSLSFLYISLGEQGVINITSGNGSYTAQCSNPEVATVSIIDETIVIMGVGIGIATITITDIKSGQTTNVDVTVTDGSLPSFKSCPDDHHPHMIDLGLPSGTKWACCNVEANNPEDFGDFYAWGETCEKSYYYRDSYLYYDSSLGYQDIGTDIARTQYDVAYVKWGGFWQMPSKVQIIELVDNCTYNWTIVNNIKGQMFTSKINGGYIFLPAAGQRWRNYAPYVKDVGNYWSSTQNLSESDMAYGLDFESFFVDGEMLYGYNRSAGLSIRPVMNTTNEIHLPDSFSDISNQAIYNIYGIKVAESAADLKTLSSGIYVINGKKRVVK